MDFDWPLKERWQGYLMPAELRPAPCKACDETGLSRVAKLLRDQWYGYAPFRPEQRGSVPFTPDHPKVRAFAERNVDHAPEFYGSGETAIRIEAERLCAHWYGSWSHHLDQSDVDALIAGDRLRDLTHRWEGPGVGHIATGHHPSAAEVNDWSIAGMGHDSINQWIVCDAECERLGIEKRCAVCSGEGAIWRDAEQAAAHDAWEPTPPPTGEGWQMWETTSEGSPISPVFSTTEALARWLSETGASAFGGQPATYDEWLNMIEGAGMAMSMVSRGGEIVSGVEALAR